MSRRSLRQGPAYNPADYPGPLTGPARRSWPSIATPTPLPVEPEPIHEDPIPDSTPPPPPEPPVDDELPVENGDERIEPAVEPPARFSKREAYYGPISLGKVATCAKCRWFLPNENGNSSCQIVSSDGAPHPGRIEPTATCALYNAGPVRQGISGILWGRGDEAGVAPQQIRYRLFGRVLDRIQTREEAKGGDIFEGQGNPYKGKPPAPRWMKNRDEMASRHTERRKKAKDEFGSVY